MSNTCVCCGEEIPEGRQTCRKCETVDSDRNDLKGEFMEMSLEIANRAYGNAMNEHDRDFWLGRIAVCQAAIDAHNNTSDEE